MIHLVFGVWSTINVPIYLTLRRRSVRIIWKGRKKLKFERVNRKKLINGEVINQNVSQKNYRFFSFF